MKDTVVRMPKLADTLVEGTLGQWLKNVGETVGQGDPLATIETDKVTTELTSPTAGTLLEQLVTEGQTVPIETPIARIGPDQPREELPPPESATASAPRPTPVAVRLLIEHGLAPSQVPSMSGRLTRDDVLAYLATAPEERPAPPVPQPLPPAQPPGELVPLSSMRRAIADHMLEAWQTIPHGQTVMAADLTGLVAWRDAHKAAFQLEDGANLTFTVFFVHALARELAHGANGRPVDLGVAVALDGGLIVPVLRAAESLTLGATARAIADLAARARAHKLAPDETRGASMTITNVGSFGNLTASPIVPLSQVGILAPGLVERRPQPTADGGIRPGWRCLLSLTYDRRALDDLAADRLLRGVLQELASIVSGG